MVSHNSSTGKTILKSLLKFFQLFHFHTGEPIPTGCPKVRYKSNHPLILGLGWWISKCFGTVNTKSLRFGLVYDIGDNHVRYSGKGGLRFLQISNLCVEKVKNLKQLSTGFHFFMHNTAFRPFLCFRNPT